MAKSNHIGPGGIKCSCCRKGLSLKAAKRACNREARRAARTEIRSSI